MDESIGVAVVCNGLTNPGRAISAELLGRGWSVIAQEAGEQIGAQAGELAAETGCGDRLAAFRAELTDEAQREDLVEFALEQFERIDLLVCAPPVFAGQAADLLVLDQPTLSQALNQGLLTPMFLAQRVANEMIRLMESETIDDGKIVFLGSLTAYTTSADQAGSCLSAAGVDMLTRLFADRLGEYGINVYQVRAGLMATRRGEPGHEKYDRLIREGLTPIRRWGRPKDVALAVAAIAGDELPFSTGQVIDVDGGFHLRRL